MCQVHAQNSIFSPLILIIHVEERYFSSTQWKEGSIEMKLMEDFTQSSKAGLGRISLFPICDFIQDNGSGNRKHFTFSKKELI